MLVRFFFVSYLHVASDSLSDMNKQIFVLTQQGRNHAVELEGARKYFDPRKICAKYGIRHTKWAVTSPRDGGARKYFDPRKI